MRGIRGERTGLPHPCAEPHLRALGAEGIRRGRGARRRRRCGGLSRSVHGCGGRACRTPLRRESQPTLWGHASRVPGRSWRGAVPPLTPPTATDFQVALQRSGVPKRQADTMCSPYASDGLSENTECHVKPARQPIPAARMVHVRSHARAPVDLACGWRADRRRGLGPPRVDPHDVGRAQRPRLPRLPNDVHPTERREETAVNPWMAGLPGRRGPVLDADGQGSFVMGPDVGSRQARRIRIASA